MKTKLLFLLYFLNISCCLFAQAEEKISKKYKADANFSKYISKKSFGQHSKINVYLGLIDFLNNKISVGSMCRLTKRTIFQVEAGISYGKARRVMYFPDVVYVVKSYDINSEMNENPSICVSLMHNLLGFPVSKSFAIGPFYAFRSGVDVLTDNENINPIKPKLSNKFTANQFGLQMVNNYNVYKNLGVGLGGIIGKSIVKFNELSYFNGSSKNVVKRNKIKNEDWIFGGNVYIYYNF